VSWFSPLTGLILAAAVIPPLLLLYFLKLRRRTQAIACTLLWKRSIEDLQANAPFQKLRRSLLLFLQLIVLLLLALSVAQPRLHGGTRNGGKLVILIDNSASMSAIDGNEDGDSRLDEAKEQAKDRVETLYGGGILASSPGETMVLAFGAGAEIMCRFTDSKPQLLAAIDRIQPTHGTTSLEDALKLSRAFTTNVNPDQQDRMTSDPADLELYSDGRVSDLADQVLRGENITYYPIGSPGAENVSFTSIAVERPYDRPTSVQVFAALANFGAEAAICDVQLSLGDTVLAIREVSVGPATLDESTDAMQPGRNNIVFSPFEQPRGAVIEVANLRADALDADNVARVVVPPPKQLKVLLMAPQNTLVKTVLEGLALRGLDEIDDPARYEALAQTDALEEYDVVVLDGYAPTAMPPARYLVFGAPPPLEGLNPYGEGKNQIALDWRDETPALKYVALDNLFVANFHLIEPGDDVRVLVEGSTSPLMVSVDRGALHAIYCTFDPLDSNWPFQRSWVNFMVNAIDTLGHAGEGVTSRGYVPGEALTTRLPAGATDIELGLPNGDSIPMQPLDVAMWSWGPARLTGLHELSWADPGSDGRASHVFAVNMEADIEGDLATIEKISIGRDAVEGKSAEDATYTPLWPWAIGLALAVMSFEWWVYHRKTFV
jgi:hypothetical protein